MLGQFDAASMISAGRGEAMPGRHDRPRPARYTMARGMAAPFPSEIRMMTLRSLASTLLLLTMAAQPATAGELLAGAAAARLVADDDMVIGGSIGPHKVKGQEGELRASAVVIQDPSGAKVALVECDVLMVNRDVLDRAARQIAEKTGIPFDGILINATHTHHAPTTATIHGYRREEAFTQQV